MDVQPLFTQWYPVMGCFQFAEAISNSNRDDLSGLPSFILAARALTTSTDRKAALRAMDELRVEDLPVLKEGGQVAGYVNRSRLTARILLETADGTKG